MDNHYATLARYNDRDAAADAALLDQIRAWVRTVDAGLITACEGIEEIAAITQLSTNA